jgi:hypothetical protein
MLICTWLVELKLATLNQSRSSRFEAVKYVEDLEEFEFKTQEVAMTLKIIETGFHKFLVDNHADLD